MPTPFRIAIAVASVLATTAACSSSGAPPSVLVASTDAVRVDAEGDARALGVSWWEARLEQTDKALPGALTIDDVPADDARVTIAFTGHRADQSIALVGVWTMSTARAAALQDDDASSELVATFSGSFVANAKRDGTAGDAIDDGSEVGIFASLARSLSKVTPANIVTSAAPSLHIASNGASPALVDCDKKDLKAKSIAELAEALDGMLVGADIACKRALHGRTDGTKLSEARPGLFGVNDFKPLAFLQKNHVTHVRAGYASSYPCTGTKTVTVAALSSVDAAKSALTCLTDSVDKSLGAYAGAAPPIGVTLTIGNELVPGYERYYDKKATTEDTNKTTFPAYASAWTNAACAVIAVRKAHDKQPSAPHVYELWNEPDDKGNAPLHADLLVPMLSHLITMVHTPGSACFDKDAQFTVGAASTLYYNQITGTPGGVAFLHQLAFYNLHPYNNWPDETQAKGHALDASEFHAEKDGGHSLAASLVDFSTQVMTIAGTKPIVMSEWGFNIGVGGEKPKYLTRAQCAAEAKEITQFFQFFANPPADAAPIAANVISADLYGAQRGECHGTDVKAFATAARAQTSSAAQATCVKNVLPSLVKKLRDTQNFSDFLCCKHSLTSLASGTFRVPTGAACTCFGQDPTKPFKSEGGTCSACPAGMGPVDSISGCGPATNAGGAPDSCGGKAEGWYCSQLRDFSAYLCKGGSDAFGHQCGGAQKCQRVGASDDAASVDAATGLPVCM